MNKHLLAASLALILAAAIPPTIHATTSFDEKIVISVENWILQNRTRKANVYQHSENPGLFRAEIHAAPTNYLNALNEWVPVVTTPTISPNPDYGFELKTAEYWAFFPEPLLVAPIKFGVGPVMGKGGEDHPFTFEALDVSYWDANHDDDYIGSPQDVSSTFLADPDRVVYVNAYVGDLEADLEYRLMNHGLKEFAMIKSLPRVPASYLVSPINLGFSAIIKNPSTDLYVDGVKVSPKTQPFTTNKEIEFRSGDGTTRFMLPVPYAEDSNEDPDITLCSYEIQKKGPNVLIRLLIPWSWLSAAERVFPIRVDASPETITAGWDLNSQYDPDGPAYSFPYPGNHIDLIVGKNIIGVKVWRPGIDFDTSVIPDTATITQVDLRIYVNNQRPSATLDADGMTGGGSPAGKGASKTYYDASDPEGHFTDCDGASYLYADTCVQSNGQYQLTLLSAAETDLENQLGDDWFSVGLSLTDETEKKAEIDSLEDTNHPQIVVTFTIPITTSVTTVEVREDYAPGQISTMDVWTQYYANASVSISDSGLDLGDLTNITYIFNSSSVSESASDNARNHYTFKWTPATGWSQVGPSPLVNIISVNCTNASLSSTSGWWRLAFKVNKTAEPASWTCRVTAYTPGATTNGTQKSSSWTVNTYIDISSSTSSISWSGNVGNNNLTATPSPITITIDTNDQVKLQVKGDGDLTKNGATIPLANVYVGQTSDPGNNDGIKLTTNYQDLYTSITYGTGIEKDLYYYLTIPDPQEAGDYTFTWYVNVIEE